MSPEAGEFFVAWFARTEELIAEGKLPDSPNIWPRFAYVGHTCLHGLCRSLNHLRCVDCMCEWKQPYDDAYNCPCCGKTESSYVLNHNRSAVWRCESCKHQWEGEEGRTCPSCGVFK